MMPSFELLQPVWLIGLVFPLLILALNKRLDLHWPDLMRPLSMRYPLLSALNKSTSHQVEGKHPNPLANQLFALILTLAVLALAQPVRLIQSHSPTYQAEPVDLILLVNTSVSMVLADYLIEGQVMDRMQMTKNLLQQLVDEFKGERIALVLLGRPASIWLPLTRDRAIVKQAIHRLQTTLAGRSSDVSATLDLVEKTFSKTNESNSKYERVVLLVSDGVQQLGAAAPDAAVEKLVSKGFRLHTLAIGKQTLDVKPQSVASLIYQPVDLAFMKHLADIGKGSTVHGLDKTSIDALLKILQKPADDSVQNDFRQLSLPLYHWPLLLSLILLSFKIVGVGKFRQLRFWANTNRANNDAN